MYEAWQGRPARDPHGQDGHGTADEVWHSAMGSLCILIPALARR